MNNVVDRGLHHQRKITRESVAEENEINEIKEMKENEIKVSNEEAKKGVMQMVAYLKKHKRLDLSVKMKK